jgi:AcrR family transcriptional regulator
MTDAPASTPAPAPAPAFASAAPRRRDPERRQRILAAAAELVAERGYHEVGMSDIGAAAGIVGSGIYRHFDGKSAVLVAMFDRVIDDLTRACAEILSRGLAPAQALKELIAAHVRIALEDRMLMRVYHNEIANLPADDNRRLRRKQRIYLEEWVHILSVLRPGVDDAAARALVHAGIGAVHSTLFYSSGLPADRLAKLMATAAEAVMFIPDVGQDAVPTRPRSEP